MNHKTRDNIPPPGPIARIRAAAVFPFTFVTADDEDSDRCRFVFRRTPSCRRFRLSAIFRLVFAIWTSILLTGPTVLWANPPEPRVTFTAMGDVPYAFFENVILAGQVRDLPTKAAFAIHVGDIKRGAVPCEEPVYAAVAKILAKSKLPMFIIPGDNEWNDCPETDAAWTLWVKHFGQFERRWKHDFSVNRQPERSENFAFLHDGVLFVGLNLVGGRVHDANEWRRRHADNTIWLRDNLRQHGADATHCVVFGHALLGRSHQDFTGPFVQLAREFQKPFLYLHGDGHNWIHDQPWDVPNLWRVQVDRGGIAQPVVVHILDDPQTPFQFDRRNPPHEKP